MSTSTISSANNPPHEQIVVPSQLLPYRQFVCWWGVRCEGKEVELPGGGRTKKLDIKPKLDKLPINPRTGNLANVSDPATWGTYREALAGVAKWRVTGIGFVGTKENGLLLVDLDNCRDPESGTVALWAQQIIDELTSYTEVSPSGTGVHIWAYGKKPELGCRKHYAGGVIEMYDSVRYLTITGKHLAETPATIEQRSVQLQALHVKVFGDGGKKSKPKSKTNGASASINDADLLAKIRASGQGAKFDRLFSGDLTDYDGDWSRADLALCSILAFWTSRDAGRMDALFQQSALYRDKWDRQDYKARTIDFAIANCDEVWQPSNHGNGKAQTCHGEPNNNGAAGQAGEVSDEQPDSDGDIKPNKKPSQATVLINLVSGAEYFRSSDDDLFASVEVNGHIETHAISSRHFKMYLQKLYFDTKHAALGGEALSAAIGYLQGLANEGPRVEVFTRVGRKGDSFYLDLCNDDWTVVEINSEGWNIVPGNAIKFRRFNGMLPLPDPHPISHATGWDRARSRSLYFRYPKGLRPWRAQGIALRVLVPPSRCGWVPPKKRFAFSTLAACLPGLRQSGRGSSSMNTHATFSEGHSRSRWSRPRFYSGARMLIGTAKNAL